VSAVFEGGVTAYSLRQKTVLLGVNEGHAKRVNCVSPRVAREMARGVTGLFDSDIGLATTGYAEAAPEHGIETPVAYWAIYTRSLGVVAEGQVDGAGLTRVQMQKCVAAKVLAALLEWLAGNR